MQTPRLHHVGIIVPDRDQVQVLLDMLGLERGVEQYVPEYQADCIFTRGPGAAIEFIVPRGKLAEFNKGIGGIHHIALEVADLNSTTGELADRGIALLEEKPVDAGRLWINFLSPTYTRGITVEFVETKNPDNEG